VAGVVDQSLVHNNPEGMAGAAQVVRVHRYLRLRVQPIKAVAVAAVPVVL
tara:strand:- start:160 stop:309 length:150 start_codon:yes stop_codon:yes gene_type:complete